MSLIIAFFACAFNIYGLSFIMNDTNIIEILERMNLKAKIWANLTILVITISVMWNQVYLIFWLIAEYMCTLCWYGKNKKDHLRNVMSGVTDIILMILAELTIVSLYYYKGIENLEYTGKINYEIQIACYLGMALVQYLQLIFREIRKMKTGYRRTLMATLAAKAVGDIVWLMICVDTSTFKKYYIIFSLLFIAEILINYGAFAIMVLKIAERSEQNKRADIHMNAYEYYLNMEEEHLQIRKMYHDMKNQLMIMEEENKDRPEIIKRSRVVQEKLDNINQFYHTGITALDMLLFDGKLKAQARNIEFDAVISEGCLDFINEEDINIIFSNAIINAIEACEKIKDGPRQVKIKAGKNLNDTLIYIKNTVSQDREKGSLSTKKKDRIMHGIGMTSIQECVEKYGGYVSVIEEDSTFQLAILFGKE